MRSFLIAVALSLGASPAPPAAAQDLARARCERGTCQLRVTPAQLLAQAEALVRERRFAEAEPLISALMLAPEMKLQSRFLAGYVASEQGDYARAATTFKAILSDDPSQTRVRLELARAMLGMGQTGSADRQFRIAEQSGELPPDVAAAIRGARQVIRSKRAWRLDLDVGIAPDSNINNATAADRINVNFGDTTLPVALDGNARAKSGTGVNASVSGGVRLPVAPRTAVLLGLDANGTEYAGGMFDDYLLQATAGAEQRISEKAAVSLEGVAAQRWFGGQVASRQFGARGGTQLALGTTRRLGVQFDVRRTDAAFDRNFSGWQAGLYATGEKAITRTLVASLGGFARRDWLNAEAFSSSEYGVTLGLGGELAYGINFGVTSTVSHAAFDAPVAFFSPDPRSDWRYSARATLGNRKIRVLGFSPQLMLSYARNDSTIAYYSTDRVRFRFGLARYF